MSYSKLQSDLNENTYKKEELMELYTNEEREARIREIIDDLLVIYKIEPPPATMFVNYESDSVYEDPVVFAKGINEVKAQAFALGKLFITATIDHLNEKIEGNTISLEMKQVYHWRRVQRASKFEHVLVITISPNLKVQSIEDYWKTYPHLNTSLPILKWVHWIIRRFFGWLSFKIVKIA